MGLLDDPFGRGEINRLKKLLAEKNVELSGLNLDLAQQLKRIDELSQEREVLQSKNNSHATELHTHKTSKERIETYFEEFRKKTNDQQQINKKIFDEMRQQFDLQTIEINTKNSECENKEKEVQKFRSRLAEIEQKSQISEERYQDREQKLAEKSERLQAQQRKLEKQLEDFATKEIHWTRVIEPQLLSFEKYKGLKLLQNELNDQQELLKEFKQSLDIRENELVKRNCTDEALTEREVKNSELQILIAEQTAALKIEANELEAKQAQISEKSLELENVRARIKTLDADTNKLQLKIENLATKQLEQKENHRERLAELRTERTTLRQESKVISERANVLHERERAIKRAENQTLSLKTKNLQLKQENTHLNELVSKYEAQVQELADLKLSHQRLEKKYVALKSNYQQAVEEVREADQHKSELHRLKLLTNRFTEQAKNQDQYSSSLLNLKVLESLTTNGNPESLEIENGWLGFSGHGPWKDEIFRGNLEELGYKFFTMPDKDLSHLIVGRKDWNKNDLLAQINERQGATLRVYSQEMFFFKIVTGRDPFDEEDNELLIAFAQDHPALQFLMSLPDPWPEITDVYAGGFFEVEASAFGVSNSPLHFLGYHVGSSSKLTITERRRVLTNCFQTNALEFSSDSDQGYKAEWGRPYTAQRLYRMAIHIRTMAALAGRNNSKTQARTDWLNDLKWLKEQYYSSYRSTFSWPSEFIS
jgi:hypothetical protein